MDIVSKINGNQVSATEFNQIATELEAGITASGQTPSDAILNQVPIFVSRFAANNFYIDSGTANAYLLSLASLMTNPVSATVGYFIGMIIRFRAGNANTGASTVNINSAGVKNLKKEDGTTDLAAGDIPTTQDSEFRYDGTSFVLQTGQASTTAKGIIEIATHAEVIAGTDTSRAITPAGLIAAFANSKTTNGYTYWPNGLIMQWVKGVNTTTGDSTQTVTFPLTFPTAVLACSISTINTSVNTLADVWFQENSKTTSSIVVQAQWPGTGSLTGGVAPQIIAIGY